MFVQRISSFTMDINDAVIRGLVRGVLIILCLMLVFVVLLLLRRIGLIKRPLFELWLRWDQWPDTFSDRILYVLAIVIVLALFVIWDSR